MKYFKKPDGSVWAFESDESQDAYITEDMSALSAEEVEALLAPVAPQLPTFGEQKSLVTDYYMDEREKMIARIASIGQRLSRAGDSTSALSCDAVVNGLLDMFQHASVEEAEDITAFKGALKARYEAAVSLASPAAKAEFKRYSQ